MDLYEVDRIPGGRRETEGVWAGVVRSETHIFWVTRDSGNGVRGGEKNRKGEAQSRQKRHPASESGRKKKTKKEDQGATYHKRFQVALMEYPWGSTSSKTEGRGGGGGTDGRIL